MIAALLLAGPRAPVVAAPGPTMADAIASGAVAARGCWSVEGGCAGRTGASAEPPLRGPLVEAWSFTPAEPGATIEEEPRVWFDRVYVSVRLDPQRAALYALDLSDGRPLLPPLVLESLRDLEPCVGEPGVFVRRGDGALALVQPVDGRWVTAWTLEGPAQAALDSAVLHQGRLYARSGSTISAWDPGVSIPLWTCAEVFGEFAVQGSGLRAVQYDRAGNASLASVSLATGAVTRGPLLGHHGGSTGSAWLGARLAAGPGVTVVQHGAPVVTAEGAGVRTSIAAAGRSDTDLTDLLALPAIQGSRWLGYVEEKGVALLRLCEPVSPRGIRWWDLAGAKDRPEFFRPGLAITLTQGTAWVGTSAFDLESRRVKCRLPHSRARFRVVPAWDRLLVVPEPGRLTAWREESALPDGPFLLGPAFDGEKGVPLAGVEGSALFRDGVLAAGKLDLDPVAGTVSARPAKGKALTRPLAEALVVVQGTDRLLYAASLTWVDRHVERLLVLADRERALAPVKDARAAKVADLLEQVLYEALARGVPEKALVDARRDLETYRRTAPTPYPSKALSVEARLKELRAPKAEQVLGLLAGALEDRRPHVQRALLRKVLEAKPDHPAAVAIVRASIPPNVKVSEPFAALAWLDMRTAFADIPTKPVEVPPEGSRPLTPGERELGAARHTWRPDLVGIESPQLLVMTSLQAPDRLAACLSLGELVCTALEQVCATGAHVRAYRWPLILQLFETAEEYRKFKSGAREPEETREWSAGHYDPSAGVSRIYIPAGDQDLEDVRRTYVHELTHHWLQERCPLFEAKDAKHHPRDVNWIVEGMATCVESFSWDVPGRRWETFVPEAQCLDLLAGAPARANWTEFFDIFDLQFMRLDRQSRHKIALRNRLGYTLQASDLNLFYATSGAVCMYLFHAGPKQRDALLAYVRDAYTGKVRSGTKHIEEHFGMSPEALGRAAVDWARGVTEGRIQRKDVFLK